MILLDTCVISESLKPNPDEKLMSWIASLPEESVHLPSIVLGELKKGIDLLDEGRKRQALSVWFEQLRQRFSGKILSVDEETSLIWGTLCARLAKDGKPCPVTDSFIAATAIRYGALLATRNTADYAYTGVELVNPWEA